MMDRNPAVLPGPLTRLSISFGKDSCLTCRRCLPAAVHGPNGKPPVTLPLETISGAVQAALPLGLRVVRLSGAPLAYPYLMGLLDTLERLELRIEIETSGAGLTPRLADRLAHLPQCTVTLGLDAPEAMLHDGLHGTPGAFAAGVLAAQLLAEAGRPAHLSALLVRGSAAWANGLVHLAEALGAASLRFTLPAPQLPPPGKNGNGHHPPVIQPSLLAVEELIALGRRVERELSFQTRLRLYFDQPPAFRGLHPQSRGDSHDRCTVLNTLSLLPTGEYSLCGAASSAESNGAGKINQLRLGQVGVDPLAALWAGHPTLQTLRAGLPERLSGVCEHCVLKSACLGYCVIENYLQNGSFWGPHWFCAAAERVGLFPAGRLVENHW